MNVDTLLEDVALSSRQSHAVVRQLGLVAICAKPVAARAFCVLQDGRLAFGYGARQWDPGPLLAALSEHHGCSVEVLPKPTQQQAVFVVSRDQQLARETVGLLAAIDENGGQESRAQAQRLGALFGYPASSTPAYLGLVPRADRATVAALLDPADRPFIECVAPSDARDLAEAIDHFRRLADEFRMKLPLASRALETELGQAA